MAQSTPLHFASAEGHLDVAELLIRHGADCENRNQGQDTPQTARLLLKSSSNLNGQDNEGWTPLHRASLGGNL